MKLTIKNIVSIMVLGSCASFLIVIELSIWMGGTHIDSPYLLAPITRYLAQSLAPKGVDWQVVWLNLYAAAFFLQFVIYAGAFWIGNTPSRRASPRRQMLLWGVQLMCGLIGFTPLLQLLAAELSFRLPLRKALAAVSVQCVLGIFVKIPYILGLTGMTPPSLVYKSLFAIDLAIDHAFFFGIGSLAAVANQNRNGMAAAHAKLLATQQLLAESIRSAERMRIARDLHDAIGHNLTALNLHLELATRQVSNAIPASMKIARDLGEELLSNVRSTVNNERHGEAINLHQALNSLCRGIPEPRVFLSIDSQFEVDMPNVAHAIFCCAQEAITNAVRHANASAIKVSLAKNANEISLVVEDDGKGLVGHVEGNGMRGMRERIETLGGSVHVEGAGEGGCMVRIHIPLVERFS